MKKKIVLILFRSAFCVLGRTFVRMGWDFAIAIRHRSGIPQYECEHHVSDEINPIIPRKEMQ